LVRECFILHSRILNHLVPWELSYCWWAGAWKWFGNVPFINLKFEPLVSVPQCLQFAQPDILTMLIQGHYFVWQL
jgi:hypothetical protein